MITNKKVLFFSLLTVMVASKSWALTKEEGIARKDCSQVTPAAEQALCFDAVFADQDTAIAKQWKAKRAGKTAKKEIPVVNVEDLPKADGDRSTLEGGLASGDCSQVKPMKDMKECYDQVMARPENDNNSAAKQYRKKRQKEGVDIVDKHIVDPIVYAETEMGKDSKPSCDKLPNAELKQRCFEKRLAYTLCTDDTVPPETSAAKKGLEKCLKDKHLLEKQLPKDKGCSELDFLDKEGKEHCITYICNSAIGNAKIQLNKKMAEECKKADIVKKPEAPEEEEQVGEDQVTPTPSPTATHEAPSTSKKGTKGK